MAYRAPQIIYQTFLAVISIHTVEMEKKIIHKYYITTYVRHM